MNFGPLEIGVILLIVLVVFGPKRLPQLGRSLGSGMREFKDAVTGKSKDEDEGGQPQTIDPPAPAAVPASPPAPAPAPADSQAERAGDRS